MKGMSLLLLGIFLVVILIILFTLFFPFVSQRHVYLGFWTGGLFNNATNTIDPRQLHTLEKKIGKKVAIANYYRGWQFLAQPTMRTELQTLSANGWRPMVSVNPYFFTDCPSQGMTLYKTIAAGSCDAFLKKIGQTLQKVDHPFFLRFAWEMNVSSMPWSIQQTKDSPKDFIAAWRHVHDLLKKEGVTHVLWVFSPQVDTSSTTPIVQLYPGDAYVDWTGLDGYNWGTTQSWSHWQSFSTIFASSYKTMTTLAPKKPLMIAEVNSASLGGDKAAWYTDMLVVQIPHHFPKIAAVVFFNEDKLKTEKVQWLVDETPKTRKAFQEGIQNPLYVSQFPDINQ